MFWECNESLLAEDGTRFPNTFFTIESILLGQSIPFEYHGLPKEGYFLMVGEALYGNAEDYGRWNRGWLALVQNYSGRKLTNAEDKLPALAGLAKLISEHTHDVYMAGLWLSHLEEDLCWRVYARREVGLPANTERKMYPEELWDVSRPAAYRAPSWSWASIDAAVLFIQMNFDHLVVTLVDRYIKPVGRDAYGRLQAAWLQLRVSPLSSTQYQ